LLWICCLRICSNVSRKTARAVFPDHIRRPAFPLLLPFLLLAQFVRLVFERAGLLFSDQFLDLWNHHVGLLLENLAIGSDHGQPATIGIVHRPALLQLGLDIPCEIGGHQKRPDLRLGFRNVGLHPGKGIGSNRNEHLVALLAEARDRCRRGDRIRAGDVIFEHGDRGQHLPAGDGFGPHCNRGRQRDQGEQGSPADSHGGRDPWQT